MFISLASEFAAFLVKDEHSIEDVLAHIVVDTFAPLQATSAFISELNNENKVRYVSQYGFKKSSIEPYSSLHSIHDRYPITDAIRERSTVWINTLPQWPEEYELLKELPYQNGEKSFICFPIEKRGAPVAVFGIFCEPVIQPDAEIDAFLKSIGNLLSLYIYRSSDVHPDQRNSKIKRTIQANGVSHEKLTDRQRIILRMMSEGQTNTAIGVMLGYSESTIRQESIKIFATLECNGRREASQLYLENLKHTPDFK
jgi:DNA-binding CsgD family transcriptional regulator